MNDPLSILLCPPRGSDALDPDPETTHERDVTLVESWQQDTNGVVGWSDGGRRALSVAAEHQDLARLVIVSLPYPEDDEAPCDLDAISAKTLLIYGSADPSTGARHARLWQQRLQNARVEMVPGGKHELLGQLWPRVLSHLAPRRRRLA